MTVQRRLTIICLALLPALGGCQHVAGRSADSGDTLPANAAHVDGTTWHFRGQPAAEEFRRLRDSGVEIVLNLRTAEEMDFDEEATVTAAGLEYHHIPVSRSGPSFDAATIERITDLVEQNPQREILLHCSSGNRVAAWYAIYLVERVGLAVDDALAQARERGLTRTTLEDRVRNYVGERGQP